MWWGSLASSWLVILARDPAGIRKLRYGGVQPEDFKLTGRYRTLPNSDFLVLVGSSVFKLASDPDKGPCQN